MKKILIILGCLMILKFPTSLYAKEDSVEETKVVLSFALTAEDRFTYEVKVSEGGSLYDGSQKITNGIMEYKLSVGEKKEFRVLADKGYEVKEIRENKESLNRDISKITITGVSKDSSLEVRYGRIENTEIPKPPDKIEEINKPEVPSDNDKLPNSNELGSIEEVDIVEKKGSGISGLLMITGDTLKISTYISLLAMVLYVLYVKRKGRTINTVECVDNKKTLKEEKKDEK